MQLPADHSLRLELNDEVHARPPEALAVPSRITYLAMLSGRDNADTERAHVAALCRRHGVVAPGSGATHVSVDCGAFRLKWERHGEFARYMIIAPAATAGAFEPPAAPAVDAAWLAQIPGETLVATEVALVARGSLAEESDDLAARYFDGNVLVGSAIGGGAGAAYTDFRVRPDGCGRLVVVSDHFTARQAGRMVQRLLEIDTYRMLALLAFPVARQLWPFLTDCERELAAVTAAMEAGTGAADSELLDRLTRLQAAIEGRFAETAFRFGASAAYYELVQLRIAELREDRLPGIVTFGAFTERRLAPAMGTCRSVSRAIETLSERVARCTQLLSTRVDVARAAQNQTLLESMAHRAKLQLRLQQTVEGLSAVAISYYAVGLVGYAAKGLKSLGLPLDPELVMGLSIPLVLALALFGLRGLRRRLGVETDHPEP